MSRHMMVTGVALTVAGAMIVALGCETALAQGRGGGRRDPAGFQTQGGGRGQRGPGGGVQFDPERMLDRMVQQHQTALGCTDEEWATLEPLVRKVLELRPRPGMGGPGGRQAGPGGGRGMRGGPAATADPEAEALKTALDSSESTDADIEAKLQALRDARKAKAAELKAAREALAAAAGTRTEAKLVLMGTLE